MDAAFGAPSAVTPETGWGHSTTAADGLTEGLGLALTVTLGLELGLELGLALGEEVGLAVGSGVGDGSGSWLGDASVDVSATVGSGSSVAVREVIVSNTDAST